MLASKILPRAVERFPDSVAVVCGGRTFTYRELGDRVARLAGALSGLGVQPGDRVAMLHDNCHRALEIYFAVAHVGAVLVPLNYRLTANDLAFILGDTGSRVLILVIVGRTRASCGRGRPAKILC